MTDFPLSYDLDPATGLPSQYDRHIIRKLSSMNGQFLDQAAYQQALDGGDATLYEVYEVSRPAVVGELTSGVTVLHPGRVGSEYYMTKGHFHAVLETGEAYFTLHGQGLMVMENPEGDWSVEAFTPGRLIYVPPRWAHRSVNTGQEALVFLWVYPANAGHDYGTIEHQGFRKLVVASAGGPSVVDNPRWKTAS